MVPAELLERFRVLSLERLGRVETAWNRLVYEHVANPELVKQMLRELHTVKGDAAVVGAHEVNVLCQKLEDLLALADKRGFEISEDCELVATMAIQFLGMMLRLKPGTPSGLDLDGFIRQVDDVVRESHTIPIAPPRRRTLGHRTLPPSLDRIGDHTRQRLATAATTVFVEYLAARGATSRSRLRDAWATLRRELGRLEVADLEPLLERHIDVARAQATDLGKRAIIVLELAGQSVSPRVAEAIDVAVLHLIRNAIDHGIEEPDERRRAGKPEQGAIHVRAIARGATVEITVEDDGRGIQLAEVRSVALANKLLDPSRADDEAALLELLFAPGFSTKPNVTPLSGRGIGMDAVRSALVRVGGSVRIDTGPSGTRVVLAAPALTRLLPVYHFLAPNKTVSLAVSARWTPVDASSIGATDPVDPLHAIRLIAGGRQSSVDVPGPSRDLALRLRWGFLDVNLRVATEPRLVTAERVCPTPDDYPLEVVTIDGQETLLLRPEHLSELATPKPRAITAT